MPPNDGTLTVLQAASHITRLEALKKENPIAVTQALENFKESSWSGVAEVAEFLEICAKSPDVAEQFIKFTGEQA